MAAKSRNLCVLGSSFTQGGRVAAPCCCRWGAGALVPVGEHCGTHWTHVLLSGLEPGRDLVVCVVGPFRRRALADWAFRRHWTASPSLPDNSSTCVRARARPLVSWRPLRGRSSLCHPSLLPECS